MKISHNGFALIELIVVITSMVILGTDVIPSFVSQVYKIMVNYQGENNG
jgi:type II secretory pathway pseudopilin PulG